METQLKKLFNSVEESKLFKDNRDNIKAFSVLAYKTFFPVFSLIVGILFIAFVVFKMPIRHIYVYGFFLGVSLVCLLLGRLLRDFLWRFPLIGVYVFFVIFSTFTLSANFASEQVREYVSIVCVIFIVPTLILDRTWRVNLFCTLLYLGSLLLSFLLKEKSVFVMDVVNLSAYLLAGILLGKVMRTGRLHNFDTERILTYERNRDALTGLRNRRKLFEYLQRGMGEKLFRPNGMFMIDIDKFKVFNDTYGHRAGDEVLNKVGRLFTEFGHQEKMKFFRYGGEEFCGLCWAKNFDELEATAERLLQQVRDLAIPFMASDLGHGVVTISIGYADFPREDGKPFDFEAMIKAADTALYHAKNTGRNCAVGSRH